jgi:hypothetical protein
MLEPYTLIMCDQIKNLLLNFICFEEGMRKSGKEEAKVKGIVLI